MTHEFLNGWLGDDVVECADCTITDEHTTLCGWHENLVSATRIVTKLHQRARDAATLRAEQP